MPRLVQQLPRYRLHKASGQAVVTFNSKDFYLGLHGSSESKVQYERLIAEFLSHCRQHPQAVAGPQDASGEHPSDLTINELFVRYWNQHVVGYYLKYGERTSEQKNSVR